MSSEADQANRRQHLGFQTLVGERYVRGLRRLIIWGKNSHV